MVKSISRDSDVSILVRRFLTHSRHTPVWIDTRKP